MAGCSVSAVKNVLDDLNEFGTAANRQTFHAHGRDDPFEQSHIVAKINRDPDHHDINDRMADANYGDHTCFTPVPGLTRDLHQTPRFPRGVPPSQGSRFTARF